MSVVSTSARQATQRMVGRAKDLVTVGKLMERLRTNQGAAAVEVAAQDLKLGQQIRKFRSETEYVRDPRRQLEAVKPDWADQKQRVAALAKLVKPAPDMAKLAQRLSRPAHGADDALLRADVLQKLEQLKPLAKRQDSLVRQVENASQFVAHASTSAQAQPGSSLANSPWRYISQLEWLNNHHVRHLRDFFKQAAG